MNLKTVNTVPLDQSVEHRLFEFMNKDRISHFYAIYDLKHLRERAQAWVALLNNRIVGYLMEYDKRILHLRGQAESTLSLLRNSNLTSPWFNIEPQHLKATKKLFKPTGPADKTTIGMITTFTAMQATKQSFTPVIRHKVQELRQENTSAFAELLGVDPQRAQDLLKSIGYGIFNKGKLISTAVSPESLEDLAIIRGVHTAQEERGKGYATSVCSTLTKKLLQQGKDVMLYVSKDNPPAVQVYTKIGFKGTGHTFLSFTANAKRKI